MGETDITDYQIIGSEGNVVGSVVYTDHTAVRGLTRTQTIEQRDQAGNTVVSESW